MSTLLIAGPTRLQQPDKLIVGSGALAAMAAAPLTHCQLWSHGGAGFDQRLLGYLEHRRVDLAGFSTEGHSVELGESGPALPDLKPAAADDFFGSLLIDLDSEEHQLALNDLQAMETRRIQRFIIAPPLAAQADFDVLNTYCQIADVLIVELNAISPWAGADLVSAAMRLQEAGPNCVIIHAGVLGGLLCYKQKLTSWNAAPVADRQLDPAIFAGLVAGGTADHGNIDFRGLKRSLTTASAILPAASKGPVPKGLLACHRSDYHDAWLKLRRLSKS